MIKKNGGIFGRNPTFNDVVVEGTLSTPDGEINTGASLYADVDPTLAANSDLNVATQKAVKSYVDNSVVGLLDLKGDISCSSNPNYPAALKGDTYIATTAGKIGGASGASVDIGDAIIAKDDNAGGTQAAVGASWFIVEHNLTGVLISTNNLSDVANVATARSNLGLGTMATQAANNVSITGGSISGITDLAIADGGTGASTQQAALNALAGAVTAARFLRGDGTNVSMSAIQASDVPTLNQNTTGTAAGLSGTQTAKFVYAAPNAADGVASFRALVASDIPTLNQNTTGTAAGLSSTLVIASGGTNATSFTAKSGNVAGLVYFDGTKLANSATVTDVGYDTSTQTMSFKNAKTSGVNSLAAGTVTAPSLAADGDSNTGLYFPGADQAAITVGGVAKVYASSTGVGIATITPNAPLSMASSYKQSGAAGSSFDTIFPIATILFKQADAANFATNTSNGNAELSLAIGTDITLGPVGGVGVYGSAIGDSSRLTALNDLKPTGYSVAARVIVVGDADHTGDAHNITVAARSSVDNGNTWHDFDLATGYRHQYWNARWLMAGKWMPIDTDLNHVHGGLVKFGVRAASSYNLLFTSISVQIAYVKT